MSLHFFSVAFQIARINSGKQPSFLLRKRRREFAFYDTLSLSFFLALRVNDHLKRLPGPKHRNMECPSHAHALDKAKTKIIRLLAHCIHYVIMAATSIPHDEQGRNENGGKIDKMCILCALSPRYCDRSAFVVLSLSLLAAPAFTEVYSTEHLRNNFCFFV